MKRLVAIIFTCLIIGNCLHAQQIDSLLKEQKPIKLETFRVFMGPNKANVGDLVFILNDLLIKDTTVAYPLLRQFQDKEIKMRFYSSEKSMKKFGVASKIGVLYCRTRKKVLIDIENQKIIRR